MIFEGRGWPDVLPACPGYQPPLGQPIILELGRGAEPSGVVKPRFHTLSQAGKELAHCEIDSTNFHSKDEDEKQTDWGRNFLFQLGAVVLIPREPLQPGRQYSVSVAVDSTEYSWSFTLAPPTLRDDRSKAFRRGIYRTRTLVASQ